MHGEGENCVVNYREVTHQIHVEIGDKGTKPSNGDMPGVFKRMGRCWDDGHHSWVGGD